MQAIDVGSVLGAARRLLAGERLARVAAHPTAGR
jgi:hypothetical protein